MRKLFCIAIVLFCCLGLQAQTFRSGPAYALPEADLLKVLRFQGIAYFNITLTGDFKGRTGLLTETVCLGSQSAPRQADRFPLTSDTLRLTVLSQPVGEGKIRLAILNEYGWACTDRTFELNIDGHILMETGLPSETLAMAHTLPLIAYTRGIDKTFIVGDAPVTGIDYCGLRDAQVHPSEWGEKFGLKNYIYYELTVE